MRQRKSQQVIRGTLTLNGISSLSTNLQIIFCTWALHVFCKLKPECALRSFWCLRAAWASQNLCERHSWLRGLGILPFGLWIIPKIPVISSSDDGSSSVPDWIPKSLEMYAFVLAHLLEKYLFLLAQFMFWFIAKGNISMRMKRVNINHKVLHIDTAASCDALYNGAWAVLSSTYSPILAS